MSSEAPVPHYPAALEPNRRDIFREIMPILSTEVAKIIYNFKRVSLFFI